MRYLKYFEKFGIDKDLENQADVIFQIIQKNPDKDKFNFSIYTKNLGNFFFKLIINPKLNKKISGQFEYTSIKNNDVSYIIYLKDRNDEVTLLHEIKHLDFRIRNKSMHETLYQQADDILKNYPKSKVLTEIFYVFDERIL